MAIFPKVQSPCPYKGKLSDILDGDVCRLCKREVFDLTHMTDGERVAFMEGCTGEVCVSYRIPVMAAAVAIAAIAAPVAAAACEATDAEVIIVGGIRDPGNVQYVKNIDAVSTPELPVVYDKSPKQTPDSAAPAVPSDTSHAGS
ncbi:MAG TPA: hypothetical protein VKB71_02565 [Rhizomicrobium sp.]|nr:hypothetical protein [Rhizomicrobium sp.]